MCVFDFSLQGLSAGRLEEQWERIYFFKTCTVMEKRPRHAKMLKKSSPQTLARRIMKLQKYTRLWELPPTFAMFYKLKMSQCIKIVFFFFSPHGLVVGGLTWEADCCGSLNSLNIHSQHGNKMKNGFHQTFLVSRKHI